MFDDRTIDLVTEITGLLLAEFPDVHAYWDWLDSEGMDFDKNNLDGEPIMYQYGRLLGVAEMCSTHVEGLLDELGYSRPPPRAKDTRRGEEAEKLRKGIEEFIGEGSTVSCSALQSLLDKVPADDSLAFLESEDPSTFTKYKVTLRRATVEHTNLFVRSPSSTGAGLKALVDIEGEGWWVDAVSEESG